MFNFASIAQWIEQRSSEPLMGVQLPLEAHSKIVEKVMRVSRSAGSCNNLSMSRLRIVMKRRMRKYVGQFPPEAQKHFPKMLIGI